MNQKAIDKRLSELIDKKISKR